MRQTLFQSRLSQDLPSELPDETGRTSVRSPFMTFETLICKKVYQLLVCKSCQSEGCPGCAHSSVCAAVLAETLHYV